MSDKNQLFDSGLPKRSQAEKILYPAIVTDINDPYDSWRIKCEIIDLRDDRLESLPYCYPIFGKNFGTLPKVGETVLVILADVNKPTSERYWFPRVFSQYQNIKEEYGIENTFRGTLHSRLELDKSISRIPSANNLYPSNVNRNRTWLIGRNNTDLYFDDNLYEIRVGKHKKDRPLEKNLKNRGFIRGEYNTNDQTTTIVSSDQIMLVSQSQQPKPNVDLNEEKLDELFNQLTPIPKGNVLVEILNLFRQAFLTHTHKYHNLQPDPDNINYQKLRDDNFERMFSRNIRIN